MLGIEQGRKWGLATLNEFREFFKLKTYTTFGGWRLSWRTGGNKEADFSLKFRRGHL